MVLVPCSIKARPRTGPVGWPSTQTGHLLSSWEKAASEAILWRRGEGDDVVLSFIALGGLAESVRPSGAQGAGSVFRESFPGRKRSNACFRRSQLSL